jgi:carotenoid cleavage dioxygenase
MMAYLDEASFKPHLHRWCFDLKTGRTRERRLDERLLEFGTINQQYAGRRHRYTYSTTTLPGWFLFNGFVKHDLDTGESWTVAPEPGRYASEPVFAPRIDARDEDDGYLLSFVMDQNTGVSECLLIDARHFDAGPVCRIALPHQLCSGTHACWAHRPRRAVRA